MKLLSDSATNELLTGKKADESCHVITYLKFVHIMTSYFLRCCYLLSYHIFGEADPAGESGGAA